jgi:hypothetical protein
MKIIIKTLIIILQFFVFQLTANAQELEECTIGVASGKATVDGRPLIWKTRDYIVALDNELVYNTSFDINFLEIVTAGKTYAWMGINDNGFAILNSLATDLTRGTSGFSNGSLMREALGTCGTIAEFQAFLDETNNTGRKTRGNFAVLDRTGEAALYEIDGSNYWKYNANDTLHAPNGYIIRTNYAFNGGNGGSGQKRFERSSEIIYSLRKGDTLSYKNILKYQMRDFSDDNGEEINVPYANKWDSYSPYGYIYTDKSICRSSSVSATVIQGVLPSESEKLSTMWTMLGNPAAAITVPYWSVGDTPDKANGNSTAPLCDISLQIKAKLFDDINNSDLIDSYKLLDGNGAGLWKDTFSAEDSIITKAEKLLTKWRTEGFTANEMLTTEENLANYAYEALQKAYSKLLTDVEDIKQNVLNGFQLKQNYPNPFNPTTKITFTLPNSCYVVLKIYDMLGKEVATVVDKKMKSGIYSVTWNANANSLPSGVYFYRIFINGDKQYSASKKLILMK